MRRRIEAKDLPFAVPPIEVLREELGLRGLGERDLLPFGITPEEFKQLMGANPRIDRELSAKLAKAMGMSDPGVWARLDANYREALAVGKPVASEAAARGGNGGADRKRPSGNIALRLPSSIHARLIEEAEREGVSLNQLLLTYAAEGLGRATVGPRSKP
jgi:hypothetical protein